MITNKDGSYNKFRLLIVSLIGIILISMIGIYIVQTISIPKIETPSWNNPTPTPSPSPTLSFPIDPQIAELYSNTSLNSPNVWNWTYTNCTNVSNWTYPESNNFTLIVGAGGSGGSGSLANISYTIVAGGGGGSSNYTTMYYTNSTSYVNTTYAQQTLQEPTPETTYNISQNISAVIGQPLASLGITNPWLAILLLGFPLLLLFSNRSVSSVFPIMFGLLMVGMFLKLEFWSIIAMVILIPFLIIIFSDR